MSPEEREEEIERIAGEVLNNMSIASALSILVEKSKEIAKNYLDTADNEEFQKKNENPEQQAIPIVKEKKSFYRVKVTYYSIYCWIKEKKNLLNTCCPSYRTPSLPFR